MMRPEKLIAARATIAPGELPITGAELFTRYEQLYTGAISDLLREHAVLDPAATVTRDVQRLRSAPPISARVAVSGHVYDVVTGLVETVVPVSG